MKTDSIVSLSTLPAFARCRANFSFLGLLLAIAASGGATARGQAITTLLSESFDNGATSSTWFTSGNAASVDASTPGQVTFKTDTEDGNSNDTQVRTILTYFSSAPVSLGIGDSLSVSLTFKVAVAKNGVDVFRFGFYDSYDQRITAGGFGQANSAFSDYRGYTAYLSTTGSGSSGAAPLGLRIRNKASNILVNNGGHTIVTDSQGHDIRGGTVDTTNNQFVSDTLYTGTFTVSRTDSDTLSISMSVTGGALTGYGYTWTGIADDYTDFDTFGISIGNGSTFSSVTFDDAVITETRAIPEPRTVALGLGAGMLGFALWARRRRN